MTCDTVKMDAYIRILMCGYAATDAGVQLVLNPDSLLNPLSSLEGDMGVMTTMLSLILSASSGNLHNYIHCLLHACMILNCSTTLHRQLLK